MAAEESMFRFSERGAMTGEESWALLPRHIGQWRVANYGVFVIAGEAAGLYLRTHRGKTDASACSVPVFVEPSA